MTDRKGRFSLRVRRADARRLRAQAIFAGDRTTTHAIAGPQVRSALPPLPTPAAKLVGMPAFPAPLGAAAFGTATLTLACSALDPSSLVISGGLDPAASTVVEIGYTRPDGASVVHDVATDANGGFSDTLATAPGQSWTAQATWGGDAKHVRASSQPCKDTSPQLPDLIISKVFQQNNDHSDVSFTVANQGAGDAGAFSVLVAQSNGQTSTSVPFSGLGAGQSASSQVGCKGGVITVTADDAHAVAETNEDNNAATTQLGC
jgi:hypothetical protein